MQTDENSGSGHNLSLRIHADIAAKLNFAAHQSAFSVLRRLQVENIHAEQRVEDLTLTLQSNPAFIREKTWPVDRIAPQGLITITDRDVEVDGGFLLNLADSVRGTVTFRLAKNGSVLAESAKEIELLAYNEWGGAGFMPELLAAFCMPNDPVIDKILGGASEVLRRSGKQDRIEGYQSRSRERVWEIASAIYSAIANLGLTYAAPPASFEKDGQKIRLPGQILDGRVATCLDSAMLFASAFEQAGFNPIVALPKGHALAGVWLQPEDLSSITIDEAETLRKRIDLRELVLIETTCVTSHPSPAFSKALAAAVDSILPDADHTFTAAVDIQRARAHKITPLGLKSDTTAEVDRPAPAVQLPLEPAPSLPDFDNADIDDIQPKTPQDRLERWKRKLLDLTLRNPLLNHRAAKTSLRIICPEPSRLEDKLADGSRIQITHVPQSSSEGQDEEIHRQRKGELITEEYARDEMERRRVLVALPPEELSRRAVEIYRKAQTALQEGGANTLYLAIGFLLWKRDQKDERKFRAPLILLPVTLERKSVRSGIKMTAHDDEPRFNTTLLEMLRRDFNNIEIQGLDGELPADKSGIDVEAIWNRVRLAVKEKPGFEVVEDVVLGHFSFAKYLMWKDLVDSSDELRNNAVVRHLMDTPHDRYGSEVDFVESKYLDRDYKPSDLLTPLPADSSQMAAIATADRGKDFVVIGPPGTGKSQTISNLIGHLLGKGKKVLFLSEKTAALEVVHRRLHQIGLGRFCLQLHSNKARKVDVLKQLKTVWEAAADRKSKADWEQKADDLRTLRNRLNRIVDCLHRKRRNGLRIHYAMGVKVRDEALASRVTLYWPTADHHDERDLKAKRDTVRNLSIQAKAMGDVSQSPFRLIETSEWTPQWETEIVDRAGMLSAAAEKTERLCNAICKATGITLPDHSIKRLDALGDLASVLVDSYRRPTSYALDPDGLDRIEALDEAVRRLKAYIEAQTALSCAYEPFAWRTLDGQELSRRWAEAERKWWPQRFFRKHLIFKEMRANGALGNPDPSIDSPTLASLRREGEALDRLGRRLSDFKDWSGHATDPAVAESLLRLGERARVAVGKLADDPQALLEIRGKVRTLLHDGNDLLATDGSVGRTAADYVDALGKLRQAVEKFEALAGAGVRELYSADRALPQIRQAVNDIQVSHGELHAWCAWRGRRAEAVNADLSPLVEAMEQGRVPPEETEKTFEAAYCTWWSKAVIGEDEALRTFSTPEHEAAIEKFRQIDDEYRKLTAEYIAAAMLSSYSSQDNVTKNSQWGVLRREIQKQRRHKPIRRLLEEAPDVLTSLTPCFMMSPLSVAQYLPLPSDQALFDVVIFDEASQITVWDAVGSITRGRQVIVAGDPKQMPPTNFFARSDDDPDGDIDVEGDLESILDEMCGAGIPDKTLNLHYRSRRESLIAFSNDRYYDNRLITFPAPEVADRAIRLIRLEPPAAFYARGGARHNQGEARAIVDEIVRRLTHCDSDIRDSSIGVVTFNAEQQTLIENLLDVARSEHPEIEPAFLRETVEPVFVKNLETVQGDERDVILFSVTYGPDRSGHVTMNFGPLNRDGGERRLNVAVTRARSEMIVFSTLHPDQIDLSRTQARAVSDLKLFLEYAEKGQVVLGSSVRGYSADFDSPFESAVAGELRMKGWQIRPQVGVSAYRIDLGVVHPDAPGRYLAGIECDGVMYHSSAFARERDKIRQAALEDLGWTIVRIWSWDWWTDKDRAIRKVDAALHRRLEETRQEQRNFFDLPEENSSNGLETADEMSSPEEPVEEDVSPTERNDPEPSSVVRSIGYLAPYAVFEGQTGPDPRRASPAQVAEGLCRIIQEEGPILAKRACDIYLRGCEIRRLGGQIKRLMDNTLRHAIRRNLVIKEDEWGAEELTRSIVRSPGAQPVVARERGPRRLEEIPPSELQLVARQLLRDRQGEFENGSEAHLKAVLDVFELRRLTASTRVMLLDILERRYSYVDEALGSVETAP